MKKLCLKVNGLTHYALERTSTREEFVRTCVGREVTLREMEFDGAPMVAAYANLNAIEVGHVGNVERMSLALVLRALRGADEVELTGRIVKAEPYLLTVEVEVERLSDEVPAARSLDAWEYTGPMMNESFDAQCVRYLVRDIMKRLDEPVRVESLLNTLDEYCEVTAMDISRECVAERSRFANRLESMADERLQAAAARLREQSQRLGGRHGMALVGGWMKHDLAETEEVRLMVARSPRSMARAAVEAEAELLPGGLWWLWRTDEVLFARTLYNMSPSRADVRRVLSCLVWLDATAEGAASSEAAEGVAALVDAALELNRDDLTTGLEVLLARANDRQAGAYALELRRLRRWQAEERVRALPLPAALDTDEGRALLLKAQEQGCLDEGLQPAGEFKSMTKASILAAALGDALHLAPLWEPFEQLWNTTNLRVCFNQAQIANYYARLMKKAARIVR